MRYSFLSLMAALWLYAFSCQAQDRAIFNFERVDSIKGTVCTISKIAEMYVLTPVDAPTKRYAPQSLDETYKAEGLTVEVSGVVGKIPPNVRMIGTPFWITAIKTVSSRGATIIKRENSLELYQQTATIQKVGDDYVLQLADGTRFQPNKLKKKYRKVGTQVKVNGKATTTLSDDRQIIYPLQVDKISKQ